MQTWSDLISWNSTRSNRAQFSNVRYSIAISLLARWRRTVMLIREVWAILGVSRNEILKRKVICSLRFFTTARWRQETGWRLITSTAKPRTFIREELTTNMVFLIEGLWWIRWHLFQSLTMPYPSRSKNDDIDCFGEHFVQRARWDADGKLQTSERKCPYEEGLWSKALNLPTLKLPTSTSGDFRIRSMQFVDFEGLTAKDACFCSWGLMVFWQSLQIHLARSSLSATQESGCSTLIKWRQKWRIFAPSLL